MTVAEKHEIRLRVSHGDSTLAVAKAMGRDQSTVQLVVKEAGGIAPRATTRSDRALSFEDRENIFKGLSEQKSFAEIGRKIDRPTSTVSREVNRNGGRVEYRPGAAERSSQDNLRRPKQHKILKDSPLCLKIEALLQEGWSPEQISARLLIDFPSDLEMQVSTETIYQALYVQSKGALKKELTAYLRSKKTRRGPTQKGIGKGNIVAMVNISQRPPEADDRAIPGHWEGDLIIGKNGKSAIATLVERSTRYVMLVALPNGHTTDEVVSRISRKVKSLPLELRRSLTWDQGTEMAGHVSFSVKTKVPVFFCDPHSTWQRGTNENTNGLLRQYFPRGTDLSLFTQQELDAVARQLNGRPRKTLGFMKPSEKFAELVALTA